METVGRDSDLKQVQGKLYIIIFKLRYKFLFHDMPQKKHFNLV